jgi:hypothetical protein
MTYTTSRKPKIARVWRGRTTRARADEYGPATASRSSAAGALQAGGQQLVHIRVCARFGEIQR